MYRESPSELARLQPRFDNRVHVRSQLIWIDHGQTPPTLEEYRRAELGQAHRPQFRHWPPIAGDCDVLAMLHSTYNVAPSVP